MKEKESLLTFGFRTVVKRSLIRHDIYVRHLTFGGSRSLNVVFTM